MATRAQVNHPSRWRDITSLTNLPNVSGSATQEDALEVGDWVLNSVTKLVYVCRVATPGSAVWYCPELKDDPLAIFPSFGTVTGLFSGSGCTDLLHAGAGVWPFASGTSGTGASVSSTTPPAGRYGILRLLTGTTSSGAAFLTTTGGAYVFGNGTCRFRADVNIPAVSDGTETFQAIIGWSDATGLGTDSVAFRYIHSENSGNVVAYTRSNSTETAVNTAVNPVHATNYFAFEIEVNAAASSSNFQINGASVATITTNIPSGTARATGIFVGIVKSVGATERGINADLMGVRVDRTTAI